MLTLILASALARSAASATAMLGQAPAPAGCHAVGQAEAGRPECPAWRVVHRDAVGVGYLDPASARREGDVVRITLRTVFARALAGGARTLDARVRFDCTRRTRVTEHLAAYDEAGTSLFDRDVTTDQPAVPPAGSPFDTVLNEYCPRRG